MLKETPFPDQSPKTADILHQWQKGPVILASSSSFRLNALKSLGFENVTVHPMPDSEEKNTNLRIINSLRPSWQDPYCVEIPMRVAKSKIEYLLSQNPSPSPETLLVSLDTLAISFRHTPKDHQIPTPMWTSRPFPKAESTDSLRKIILANFRQLTKANHNFLEFTDQMPNPSLDALSILKFGYLTRLVVVNTGIALRLPNQDDIMTTSVSSCLELNHVYSLNNDSQKLNRLIDQIFKITEKSGRSPLNISGGIDYSNPKILKLLGAKEISYSNSATESGLYRGFPKNAFQNFLFSQAEKVSA